MTKASVCIVQRRLTHYRVAFFESLRSRLAEDGIELRLLHGEGTHRESGKQDSGEIAWAEKLPTRYFLGERASWIPFTHRVKGADLLVITQENAQIVNQLALVRRPAKRLAFWGHGGNLQGDMKSLRERYKRWSTGRADWYFAYTSMSVELAAATGFPKDHITCVNNSVDLVNLAAELARISEDELIAERAHLGLGVGPVGLFLGSLYAEKRLDFLITAAEKIRAEIPDFRLLIAGAGPDAAKVTRAAAEHDWLTYMGPTFGRDKARALRLATLYMNPGLIGLGILDAFTAGLPVLTTDCGLHSPEISYLDSSNGIATKDDLFDYVDVAVRLLKDQALRDRLADGGRASATRFGLETMVENFADGIRRCLTEVPAR